MIDSGLLRLWEKGQRRRCFLSLISLCVVIADAQSVSLFGGMICASLCQVISPRQAGLQKWELIKTVRSWWLMACSLRVKWCDSYCVKWQSQRGHGNGSVWPFSPRMTFLSFWTVETFPWCIPIDYLFQCKHAVLGNINRWMCSQVTKWRKKKNKSENWDHMTCKTGTSK